MRDFSHFFKGNDKSIIFAPESAVIHLDAISNCHPCPVSASSSLPMDAGHFLCLSSANKTNTLLVANN